MILTTMIGYVRTSSGDRKRESYGGCAPILDTDGERWFPIHTHCSQWLLLY